MDAQDFAATAGPAKVQRMIDYALERGLTVEYDSKLSPLPRSYTWTISSGVDHDDTRIWLFWSPGPNGGRLGIRYYRGAMSTILGRRRRSAQVRCTRREAFRHIGHMADTLERHQAREALRPAVEKVAARFQPAVVTNGSDLSPGMKLVICNGTPDSPRLASTPTGRALVARGLAVDKGNGWCALTDQGRKVRRALLQAAAANPNGLHDVVLVGPSWVHPIVSQDPQWFREGQVIRFRGDWLTVVIPMVRRDTNQLCLGVTINGGYGNKIHWYESGQHNPGASSLGFLLGDEPGLTESDRRAWPQSLSSALAGVTLAMREQCLEGWASGRITDDPEQPNYVAVHIRPGIDPARHLALLERYVPYPVRVELASPIGGGIGGWVEIQVRPLRGGHR